MLERIRVASSPEEAARIGRTSQRLFPELIRPDWDDVKLDVMRAALRAKMTRHAAPRALLLASAAGTGHGSAVGDAVGGGVCSAAVAGGAAALVLEAGTSTLPLLSSS